MPRSIIAMGAMNKLAWLPPYSDVQTELASHFGEIHKKTFQSILEISDSYQQDNSTSPKSAWLESKNFLHGYSHYFHPLNLMRSQGVINRLSSVLPPHWTFDSVIDFGIGFGAATLALHQSRLTHAATDFFGIEEDPAFIQKLTQLKYLKSPSLKVNLGTLMPAPSKGNKQLLVMSYSLNEIAKLSGPESDRSALKWLFDYESILILEPSTHQCGRQLLLLRQMLLNQGYTVVAPCTHQGGCPLLSTKSDWCHDRFHWEAPPFFEKLRQQLPMKQQTLTVSYLLVTKRTDLLQEAPMARRVGDVLTEKGKTRQMICLSEERLFLTALHKDQKSLETVFGDRGESMPIPSTVVRKGNELRVTTP